MHELVGSPNAAVHARIAHEAAERERLWHRVRQRKGAVAADAQHLGAVVGAASVRRKAVAVRGAAEAAGADAHEEVRFLAQAVQVVHFQVPRSCAAVEFGVNDAARQQCAQHGHCLVRRKRHIAPDAQAHL
eukprot:scaffold1160_cov261-Pinguiococcus_pyrenoidosus.AAC.6